MVSISSSVNQPGSSGERAPEVEEMRAQVRESLQRKSEGEAQAAEKLAEAAKHYQAAWMDDGSTAMTLYTGGFSADGKTI